MGAGGKTVPVCILLNLADVPPDRFLIDEKVTALESIAVKWTVQVVIVDHDRFSLTTNTDVLLTGGCGRIAPVFPQSGLEVRPNDPLSNRRRNPFS